MSRRPPNPSAERTAQNQQTLKTLVKIESNKSCADCKKNKHPRWASWSLGIFICIRCSGIHRGMGTHISRVKSVDLDAWTDEQLQNMLRWGNARANRYWEAKLGQGHVPSEAKIENFIRTKYESRRWVLSETMPDPATLETEESDDVPLSVIKEKVQVERAASLKATSSQPPRIKTPERAVDLFGDDPDMDNSKPITTSFASSVPPPTPPKTSTGAPKPAKAQDSLLGFDFFGAAPSNPPPRPSSASPSLSNSNIPRPDLKQSILSLYASAPRSSNQPQPAQTASAASGPVPPQTASMSLSGLESDFSTLSFSPTPSFQQQAAPQSSSPFANLTSPSVKSTPQTPTSSKLTSKPVAGGSFFESKPIQKPTEPVQQIPERQRELSSPSGFGDFESATSPVSIVPKAQPSSNGFGDLFDTTSSPPKPVNPISAAPLSPFNLSAPSKASPPKPSAQTTKTPSDSSALLNMDAWGSNEAWASSSGGGSNTAQPAKAPATVSASADDWGWGGSGGVGNSGGGFASSSSQQPQVTADEDYGGWESGPVVSPQAQKGAPVQPPPKPLGSFGGGDADLFSNVWE